MTTARGHNHAEAFCLMKYQTEDGLEVEWIWNSRDGVTPFIVHSRAGREMSHADWHLDRYLPNYRPAPGERIFVDLTPERAREFAEAQVERYWDHPEWSISDRWPSKEAAVEAISADMLRDAGQPDVIEARDWRRGS